MTAPKQDHTEDLFKAHDQVIKDGITAIENGWKQTTEAAKRFAAAAQSEMEEAGKTWEVAINDARNRNENLTDLLKESATFPNAGKSTPNPETKDMFDQLIEGAKSFSQSWTGYVAGLENRQIDFLKGMSDTNSKVIESSKDLAKSAAVYSEAFLEWSKDAAKGVSAKVKS